VAGILAFFYAISQTAHPKICTRCFKNYKPLID
jgi:hypothetical protein